VEWLLSLHRLLDRKRHRWDDPCPELNSRVDELGEYDMGHKKLTPLGVVSGCRLRRDGFSERLALFLQFSVARNEYRLVRHNRQVPLGLVLGNARGSVNALKADPNP